MKGIMEQTERQKRYARAAVRAELRGDRIGAVLFAHLSEPNEFERKADNNEEADKDE